MTNFIEPGKIYWFDGEVVLPSMNLKIIQHKNEYYLENQILSIGPFSTWKEAAIILKLDYKQEISQ